MAEYIGVKYAVALSSGTVAIHLATKLAAERLFEQAHPNEGTLAGKKYSALTLLLTLQLIL